MENIFKTKSKPIDIVKETEFHTSYNTFVENIYIEPVSMSNSPILHSDDSTSSTMKKSLSLDHFWPNTPPSFSPNKNMLEIIRKMLHVST